MLIVTIAALVMAASLGCFAYRLLREEQRRSEARVALLTAALDIEPEPVVTPDTARAVTDRAPSTLPSIVMLEDEGRAMRAFPRERGAAQQPADALLDDADVLHAGAPQERTLGGAALTGEPTGTGGLFAEVPAGRPADARGLVAVVAVVLVAMLAAGYAWFGRAGSPAASTAPASVAQAPTIPVQETNRRATPSAHATPLTGSTVAAPAGVPLELLALRHEQQGQTLIVRGVVRNPVSGSERAGVLARVTLLDAAGTTLGDASARIDTSRLRPGTDAAFAVQLPSRDGVRRYRVTFGAADGALLAHVDRRG